MSTQITFVHRLTERRRIVLPLAAILVANLLVYVFVVYPLSQRVANVEERDRTAEQTLAAARLEFEAARGTLTGKERASTELTTFYRDVLPSDLAGARRLTYRRLAQLARQAGLSVEHRTLEEIHERDSTLARVKSLLELRGSYEEIRTFIYQLETAPEFVVIDDIGLAEGSDDSGELVLTLQLSTYFRQ